MKNEAQVWKWPLQLNRLNCRQTLYVPVGTKFLSAQYQGSQLCIWGLVPACNEPERINNLRTIYICGTGHDISSMDIGQYIATVQDGPFVWHIFEAVADSD